MKLARWAEENAALYTEVAAKFDYVGMRQIQIWREIYRQKGANGLWPITKGRKPSMTNKKKLKKKNIRKKVFQKTDQQRIKELEDENMALRIKLEASKLLALMKQRSSTGVDGTIHLKDRKVLGLRTSCIGGSVRTVHSPKWLRT